MAVTQPRSEMQLPLRPYRGETSAASEPPAAERVSLSGVVWWDVRDRVWRGLVLPLSLFAEADTKGEVVALLTEKVATYVEDVREQGLEDELIPRPLSLGERRKLEWYLRGLQVRAWLSHALFPTPHIPIPVVQRVPIYWRA